MVDETYKSDALLRNGDEVDARMEQIQQILGHAAMRLLDRYALVAEWVRHAELKTPVSDQNVAKPRGGRPEGGITRAASGELPIPGKTPLGCRKYIVRAISIDAIWNESEVCGASCRVGQHPVLPPCYRLRAFAGSPARKGAGDYSASVSSTAQIA